jgi:soluble lytic murein transglycosylase
MIKRRAHLPAWVLVAIAAHSISTVPSWITTIQGVRVPVFGVVDEINWDHVDPVGAEAYLRRVLSDRENINRGSIASTWWARYNLAKLIRNAKPEESCHVYRSLSLEPNFPIRDLARVRAMEVCPIDLVELKRLAFNLDQAEFKYLHGLIAKIGLDKATLADDAGLMLVFALKNAKVSKVQGDKIRFLRIAEKAAERTGPSDKLSEIRADLVRIAPRLQIKADQTGEATEVDPTAAQASEPPVDSPVQASAAPLTTKVLWSVAQDYKQVRQFAEARQVYLSLVKHADSDLDDKIKAWSAIAMTYKLGGEKTQFLNTLEETFKFIAEQLRIKASPATLNHFQQTGLKLARAHWTENNYVRATKILESMKVTINGRIPTNEIHWIEARIAEERGDFESTLKLVRNSLRSAGRGETRERLLWLEAWTMRRLGQRAEALPLFERLTTIATNNFDRNRYRFWLARTLRETQRNEESEKLFEQLATEDTLGYYGVMALRELGRELPPLQQMATIETSIASSSAVTSAPGRNTESSRELASLSPAQPTSSLAQTVNWMISLQERDIAQAYLEQQMEPRSLLANTPDQLHDNLKIFASTGHYRGLFEIFSMLAPDARSQVLERNPDYVFPSPYKATVAEAASKVGIPTELVYSIMRQESSFNNYARSPADAFGLMQLIPQTAGEVSRTTGITWAAMDQLYGPNLNVSLGASYLRMLWDRYDGQFILSVASYNASEDAVRNWARTRFRGDAVEFIEDIPYEETRTYVRLVLRNFVFYLRMGSERPIKFPEWCLENLQDFTS